MLSLDGKRMENGRQFRINLYTRAIGDTVAIEVQRGERRLHRAGRGRRAGQTTRGGSSDLVGQQSGVPALGVLALDLSPRVAAILPPLRRDKGVVVATVSAAAPFSQQGRLQAGDVIYSLNGKIIEQISDLNALASTHKAGHRGRPANRAAGDVDVFVISNER